MNPGEAQTRRRFLSTFLTPQNGPRRTHKETQGHVLESSDAYLFRLFATEHWRQTTFGIVERSLTRTTRPTP